MSPRLRCSSHGSCVIALSAVFFLYHSSRQVDNHGVLENLIQSDGTRKSNEFALSEGINSTENLIQSNGTWKTNAYSPDESLTTTENHIRPVGVGTASAYALLESINSTKLLPENKRVEESVVHESLGPVFRDCNLEGLATLLNSFDQWNDLQQGRADAKANLMEHLSPWIAAEPARGPRVDDLLSKRPALEEPTCDASTVFSGRRLVKPRPIVDIIPFAYDFSLLELRLLESSDIVDLFVVSESATTEHFGLNKLMYFDLAKEQQRFARFRDKILHLKRPLDHVPSKFGSEPGSWSLEVTTRGWPTACLGALLFEDMPSCWHGAFGAEWPRGSSSRRLVEVLGQCGYSGHLRRPRQAVGSWGVPQKALQIVKEGRMEALILENDEDEMISRGVLWQLKNCELAAPGIPIYTPNLVFKLNAHLLQRAHDGNCDGGELAKHMWVMGPHAQLASHVVCNRSESIYDLETDGTNHLRKSTLDPCNRHSWTEVLSAMHLSSSGDLAQMWLKSYSVLEFKLDESSFPPDLVTAGEQKVIDSSMLQRNYISLLCEGCKRFQPLTHISTLSKKSRQTIEAALPWAMKSAPERYCFQMPAGQTTLNFNSSTSGAHPDFCKLCSS